MANNHNKKITSSNNTRSSPFYIFLVLLILLVLSIGFIAYIALTHDIVSSISSKTDQAKLFLIDTNPQGVANNPIKDISSWILILIAGFGTLQIIPILIAALKAKKMDLTTRLKKEITFLCETPMYLGLLGSLLGVCLTQFMTGTLSAPLAYITTIIGILLHLFAKFTIIVPLPGSSVPNTVEEV